jgi:hypothetical protein
MPTNNSGNNSRQSGEGSSIPTRGAGGPSGRTRDKHRENGNRARTRFADRARVRGRVLVALAAVCAVELVYALLTSPARNVNRTTINGIAGTSNLSKDEIETTRRAGALPAGTNWLLAPVGQIQKRLTSLPWVRDAHAARRLPTDIEIELDIRKPSYSLITPTGRYEVAEDNTPIRTLRRQFENSLTPIFDSYVSIPRPGAAIADAQVCMAAQILHRTQGDTVLRIAKIEIDQTTNIWLNMSTGVRIKFGHCEDADKKIAMIRRLLSHDQGKRFAEINVSSPDWPAGTLRETVNPGEPAQVAAAGTSGQLHGAGRTGRAVHVSVRQTTR